MKNIQERKKERARRIGSLLFTGMGGKSLR